MKVSNSQVDKTSVGTFESSPARGNDSIIDSSGLKTDNSYAFRIEISDICGLSPCADLSLPPGAGFCIDTVHGQKYLVNPSISYLSFFTFKNWCNIPYLMQVKIV